MKYTTVSALVAFTAMSLACGGGGTSGPDLTGISGEYCDEDDVCYKFSGERSDEYIDGELMNPGSWTQADDLFVLTFDDGATWTAEIRSYTGKVLVLFDLEEFETVTLVKR